MKNWISLKEKLPEVQTLVNIYGGDVIGVTSGYFQPMHNDDNSTFNALDDWELTLLAPTHWQPLPSEPNP